MCFISLSKGREKKGKQVSCNRDTQHVIKHSKEKNVNEFVRININKQRIGVSW